MIPIWIPSSNNPVFNLDDMNTDSIQVVRVRLKSIRISSVCSTLSILSKYMIINWRLKMSYIGSASNISSKGAERHSASFDL